MHSNRGLSRRNCLETMSCSWGTELWDQFDNLEKHTQWGIEFLERYTKFVKERSEIELSYAKQIRNLSKKYQLKKNSKEEEEFKTSLPSGPPAAADSALLDMALPPEFSAPILTPESAPESSPSYPLVPSCSPSSPGSPSSPDSPELHFHDGRRAQQHIENSWKQLESSKRRFERDCKEADRAQHYFDKMDADINVTKADVEKRCSLKAKQQAQMRHQIAEDSKNEYLTYLQKFNKDQHEHYYTLIPHIFQRIQEMEERRVGRVRESMRVYTEVEHKVLPIVSKCLDGMTKAAESIEPKMLTGRMCLLFVSSAKSPSSAHVAIAILSKYGRWGVISTAALIDSYELEFLNIFCALDILSLLIFSLPVFLHSISQCAPSHLHPPTSPSPDGLPNGPQSPQQPKEPLSQRLNGFMGTKHKMHCLRSLKRGLSLKLGTGQEDYSHLPPEQRRKKLQAKLNDINKDIQKEMDQRDALTKMKDVYIKNPHLGDPDSVDPRLEEITQSLEKLQLEAHKFEGWLTEVERKLLEKGSESQRRQSSHFDSQGNTPLTNNYGQNRERYFSPCQNEGTISMAESEMLYVIEEDKGDGWTRVRKNEDEEGYVPTSYIKLFLDMNAKGAMTYI
ncbi:formin-binding protein 1-like [Sinocyclocheilus grahami]|uniref:formin-binding protein 1-like n=2 Tax=Sinocyclocheilus grahami TaxID=75366 RepID=UPI0007ACFA5D|nr:PREDICTED: formin-binding protein 1-like [Sinocyclocheilus grahami]